MAAEQHSQAINFVKYIITIYLLSSTLIPAVSYPQSQWYFVHPLPTGNLLNSVSFLNINTGIAAGSVKTIISTYDGGLNWFSENPGIRTDINDITFIDKNSVTAVCNKGIILKKTFTDNLWTVIKSGTQYNLYDVCFTSAKTGFITGLYGTILKSVSSGNYWVKLNTGTTAPLYCTDFLNAGTGCAGGFNIIIKTTDSGISWINLNVNISHPCQITDIKLFSPDTITAMCNTPSGKILKSFNGGINWLSYSMNLPLLYDGTADLVRSFSFINSLTGFAVTDFGTILKTENGGVNWTSDSSFRPGYEKYGIMKKIFAFDSSNIFISGGGGTVMKSINKGESWMTLSGNRKDIKSVFFTNEFTGYSAGEKGGIHKTTDSGNNWKILDSETDVTLNSIIFTTVESGYVTGNKGVIMKTTDTGNIWSVKNSGTNENLKSLVFINSNTGFAAGGEYSNVILKTTDSGELWYEIYFEKNQSGLEDMEFINFSTGFVAGKNGIVMKTTNCGESWIENKISPTDIFSVSFYDSLNGITSGADGLIFKTTDGGSKWEYIPNVTYKTLYSIEFITQQLILSAGRDGTVLFSTNEGNSWSLPDVVTNNSLFNIFSSDFAADKKITFIAGEFGTILKSEADDFIKMPLKEMNILYSNLFQNYPNPFNQKTIIIYQLAIVNFVLLKVYDVLGNEVVTLVKQKQNAGNYEAEFDGSNLPGGVYFCSLVLNGKVSEIRRIVLLK